MVKNLIIYQKSRPWHVLHYTVKSKQHDKEIGPKLSEKSEFLDPIYDLLIDGEIESKVGNSSYLAFPL